MFKAADIVCGEMRQSVVSESYHASSADHQRSLTVTATQSADALWTALQV